MPVVIEWSIWDSWNPRQKRSEKKAIAVVDFSIDSKEILDENIKITYQNHAARVQKVMSKLQIDSSTQIPRKIVHQLQEMLAGDLRECYGRDRRDAKKLTPLRNVDMVSACERLGFSITDDGWEKIVLNAIEIGDIKS